MNLHTATSDGIDGRSFAAFHGTLENLPDLERELDLHHPTAEDAVHAAFMAWHQDFLAHLKGAFALAVFDLDGNRLILARDHFGTVPLYYTLRGTVAFASRTDEFLQKGIVPRTARLQAIWDYLSLGAVPQPNTIVDGIRAIPPATAVTVDLASRSASQRTWWSVLDDAQALDLRNPSLEQAARQVRQRLDDSLTKLMPRLGNARLLLSGTPQSAILLKAMTRLQGPVRTLALDLEGTHAATAGYLAKAAGAHHRTVPVDGWDLSKGFARFIRNMDQPSQGGLELFLAAKAAHEDGAEAIVTGLGGDELFAGYPHVLHHLKARSLAPGLSFLRPLLRRLGDRFRHSLMLPALSRAEQLETVRAQLYDQGKRQILNPELIGGKALAPWLQTCQAFSRDALDCVHQDMLFDVSLNLDHSLLRDAFLQTEGYQVTHHSPMLSPSLAALAFALPADYVLQKKVLLKAYGDLLPKESLTALGTRPEPPLCRWLGSTLLPKAREAFNSQQAKTLFRRQYRLNWAYRLTALRPGDTALWSRFMLLQYLMSRNITSFA